MSEDIEYDFKEEADKVFKFTAAILKQTNNKEVQRAMIESKLRNEFKDSIIYAKNSDINRFDLIPSHVLPTYIIEYMHLREINFQKEYSKYNSIKPGQSLDLNPKNHSNLRNTDIRDEITLPIIKRDNELGLGTKRPLSSENLISTPSQSLKKAKVTSGYNANGKSITQNILDPIKQEPIQFDQNKIESAEITVKDEETTTKLPLNIKNLSSNKIRVKEEMKIPTDKLSLLRSKINNIQMPKISTSHHRQNPLLPKSSQAERTTILLDQNSKAHISDAGNFSSPIKSGNTAPTSQGLNSLETNDKIQGDHDINRLNNVSEIGDIPTPSFEFSNSNTYPQISQKATRMYPSVVSHKFYGLNNPMGTLDSNIGKANSFDFPIYNSGKPQRYSSISKSNSASTLLPSSVGQNVIQTPFPLPMNRSSKLNEPVQNKIFRNSTRSNTKSSDESPTTKVAEQSTMKVPKTLRKLGSLVKKYRLDKDM